jgi:zinc/manganese transport system ATP-binding protein
MIELSLNNITVTYGSVVAIEDVSLALRGPGLVQLLGPNGAGKTTLMKVVAGLVRPRRGRVLINGVDVTGNPGRASRFVAYMPQLAPEVHVPLTPIEAVEMYASLRLRRWPRLGSSARSLAAKMLEAVKLPRRLWYSPLTTLSSGERQKVMLARILVANTPILLLDEPLASIDPPGRVEIANLIASLSKERLVIVSTHDPTLLLAHTSSVILLHRRVVAVGPPGDVLKAEILSKVYGKGVVEVPAGHLHIVDSHSYAKR